MFGSASLIQPQATSIRPQSKSPAHTQSGSDARTTRSDTKAKLLAGIAKARIWLDEVVAGRILDIANLAQREKRSVRSTAMLLSLAFLAPGLKRLVDLPMAWPDQWRALGLEAPARAYRTSHVHSAVLSLGLTNAHLRSSPCALAGDAPVANSFPINEKCRMMFRIAKMRWRRRWFILAMRRQTRAVPRSSRWRRGIVGRSARRLLGRSAQGGRHP